MLMLALNDQKCSWSLLISRYRYIFNDCHKLHIKNKVKLPRENYLLSFEMLLGVPFGCHSKRMEGIYPRVDCVTSGNPTQVV